MDKYPGKEIFVGIYSPGRRLTEFRIEMKNISGILANITKIIADLNANILSGFITAFPEEPISSFSFILDLTNSNVKPEEVAEKIGSLDAVLDVKYQEPDIKGLMVDDMHFPLLAIGERSILFRVDTIKNMFSRLYKQLGNGATIILHSMGRVIGESKAAILSSRYKIEGSDLVKVIFAERVSKGWGIPKLIKINEDKGSAVVRVDELFECYPMKGKTKEPMSHFFKGYLEGIFSFVFNKDIDVMESYCVAKGDEYCEFYITEKIK